jgi:hypothetical protein
MTVEASNAVEIADSGDPVGADGREGNGIRGKAAR